MGTQVTVTKLPKCNFCDRDAEYDFRTYRGPWANGCEFHWKEWRATDQLGTGHGQKLVVAS